MEYEFSRKKARDDWAEFCKMLVEMRFCEDKVDYIVDNEEIHNRHDKGYKYLLSIKKNFVDFVKTFMKISWNEEITEDNIRLMDKEFITVDFDKRESDLIYEVEIKDKKAYFILLEIQSKIDRKMAYRLLNYMIEIWRKWETGLRNKGEKFILPKIIPCVLYNGEKTWTAPIEFRKLYDDIDGGEEYLINFKYILIDVHKYTPEYLLEIGNVISSAFYLDTATKEEMGERLIKLTESFSHADSKTLKEFKTWLINMFVFDEEKQEIIEEKFVKEEEEMGNLAKIGREIYEDGVRDGIERGIEEGIEKGRSVYLQRFLNKKLKEKNEKISLLIETASTDKLDEIEDKIFEIDSWNEVEEILR